MSPHQAVRPSPQAVLPATPPNTVRQPTRATKTSVTMHDTTPPRPNQLQLRDPLARRSHQRAPDTPRKIDRDRTARKRVPKNLEATANSPVLTVSHRRTRRRATRQPTRPVPRRRLLGAGQKNVGPTKTTDMLAPPKLSLLHAR